MLSSLYLPPLFLTDIGLGWRELYGSSNCLNSFLDERLGRTVLPVDCLTLIIELY